ncbi:unnamed protein product [Sphagnum jensenii]|uniref:DNA polymerase zeta catalytic subunit n=1 Tax=Sphagnum jensenii TaxID=128206 RepID=A0ABP1B6Y2_9BRYO
MFSMRIVSLEYYMAPPLPDMDVCYSQFQGCAVNEVPVVRIYGSTPAGQKACLHLHQVFPYFYVPYDEDLPQDIKEALAYVRCLASAVEKAMKLTNNMAAKKQHVHSCSLVRARKYYGYHPAEQLFIKIVLYHPQDVSRIGAMLMGGGIMNRKFQPHEAHVPYLLQLLIDQNLSGMSHIHLSGLKFRHPLPESLIDIAHVLKQLKTEFASQASISTPEAPHASSSPRDVLMAPGAAVMETVTPPLSNEKWAAGANGTSQAQVWVGATVPSHWQWPGHYASGGPFARHSTCALEADASIEEILNRRELLFMPLQQVGSAIKMVQSLTPMWEEERVRSGEDGPASATAVLQPSAERVISSPSALEQALRASLSQMIQGNEMLSQAEVDSLQNSVGKTQEMLLESTQAANSVRQPGGSNEMGHFSETMVAVEAVDAELLNEQIVRTSLTQQDLTSQEEVAELLRWMGASLDDRDGDDSCSKDERGHEAYDLSQVWGSAGMEAAMLQAISEYETETHQECQAILECVDDDDESDTEENVEDLFEAVLENNEGIGRIGAVREQFSNQVPESSFQIPQIDGAGDDDVAESASSPIRKRLRKCVKDSPCHVGKEEGCNIHRQEAQRKEAQRRVHSAWGSLPITFVPLGCKNERQVSRTERTIPCQAVRCPCESNSHFPQHDKVELSHTDASGPVISQEYREGSKEVETGKEVSLRSLMRRQRNRQPHHQRKCSPSRGPSSRDSHNEGEHSSEVTAGNLVKTEFGGCMDTIFPDAVIADEEVSQKHAVPAAGLGKYQGTQKWSQKLSQDQRNLVQKEGRRLPTFAVLPVVNMGMEPNSADLQPRKHVLHKAQRSPTKGQFSGKDPRDRPSEDQLPFESSGEYQHIQLDSEVNKNQEHCGEWKFGLLQSSDHRDCGGGSQSCVKITASKVLERERHQFATLSEGETVSPLHPFSKEYQDLHLASSLGLTATNIFTSENPELDIKDSLSAAAAVKPLMDTALGSSHASQRLLVHEGKLDTSLYTPGSLEEMETQTSAGGEPPEERTENGALASPVGTIVLDPVTDDPNGGRRHIVTLSNLLIMGHVDGEPNVEEEVLLEAAEEGIVIEQPLSSGRRLLPIVDHEVESGAVSIGQLKAPAGQISNDNMRIADESGMQSSGLYLVHAESEPRVQEDVKLQTDKTQMGLCSNIAVEASRGQNSDNGMAIVRQVAKVDSALLTVPTELDFRLHHLVETGCDGPVGGAYKSQHQVSDKSKQPIHFTDISDESSGDSFDWGDDGGDFSMSLGRDHEEDSEDESLWYPRTGRDPDRHTNVELEMENTVVATATMATVSNEEKHKASLFAALETNSVSLEANRVVSDVPINAGRNLLVVPELRMSELPTPLDLVVVPEYKSPCYTTPEQEPHDLEQQQPVPLPNVSERKHGGKKVSFSEPSVIRNVQIDTTEEEEEEETLIPVQYHREPPKKAALLANLDQYGLKPVEYRGAFYGNSKDVPPWPMISAGLIFDVKSKDVQDLPPFVFPSEDKNSGCGDGVRCGGVAVITEDLGVDPSLVGVPCHYGNDGSVSYLLTPAKLPPSPSTVRQWLLDVTHVSSTSQNHSNLGTSSLLESEFKEAGTSKEISLEKKSNEPGDKQVTELQQKWRDVSQITAPSPAKGQLTPFSQSGFRDPASLGAGQQVTLMSIEVHSETRGDLRPDPRYDTIGCIVVVIKHDDEVHASFNNQTVVLIVDATATSSGRNIDGLTGCVVIYLSDELALFTCFVRLVHLCDPDMLVGWEIQGFSLGLLAERAANLGFGILKQLSRIPPRTKAASNNGSAAVSGMQQLQNLLFGGSKVVPLETVGINDPIIEDEWGRTHGSGIFVGGRVVLNLWRIMRGEVKLGIYTLEAVAEAVLKRRVPRIPWCTLTRWFRQGPASGRFRCIEYFVDRARLNFEIMDQLDLLNRTAELARVFGIDFFSVFSRGSQYRVESMMLRLAHTQNFVLISPNKQQVAAQPAMECLPLVMEPESRFYTSPVVVLDFQSLYPSMIIAYNLCFSTCLGKIVPNNPKVLGVTNLALRPGLLKELKEQLTITPNGVLYTPPEVCHGVLPRLLREILSTRIMVKQAMKKLSPKQRVLQRVLNARQFALKLIANVTYGYTAAGFSGRMPCAELADSIVQCGRLTLERAIHLVNSTAHWNAQVVYGDTDSMFVHLEGRTKEDAFKIGQEIAAAVTAMNPTPVTLKMEKVYHPCVLLTKKRYVGYSFESPGQLKPIFDAKGIETVRRDSCAAVAKTLERSLQILFETQDLSQVKQYLQRQWSKILSGRISLHDFIFAKEVRLGTYSARASVLPPAAIVASKAMAVDPRAEPRYGERVPYVVVHGEPGARLSDVVVDPHTMLANELRLHDTYYITKQIIPALQRVFGLVGADLKLWFAELPRVYRPPTSKRVGLISKNNPFKFLPNSNRRNKEAVQQKGTIDHYYLSQHCTVCGQLMRGSQLVCTACISNPQAVVTVLTTQTAQLEKEFKHLEALCRHCGGANGEPEGHIACISLDCPIFFERLKVQKELQSSSVVSSQTASYPPSFLDLF